MSLLKQNEEKLDILEKNNSSKKNELKLNEIKIIKRTLENNTHEVLEDKRLKSITSWRKSKTKFYKILIFNILTFGILHWISLHYPNLYIKLYCNPWPAKECDFFLVENIYGQFTLCIKNHKKQKESKYITNRDESEEKIFSTSLNNNISNNLTYSFKYKSMIYEYKLETNEIIPVYINLSKMTNKKILNSFGEGLYSDNLVKKMEERYGKNEYYINPNLLHLYLKKIQTPTFIIIFLSGIGELIIKDLFSFFSKLIFIILILLNEIIYSKIIAYNIYKNENTLDGESKLKVKRKHLYKDKGNFYIEINNKDLLPGDILYLKINDIVPCDCLIIEGECIVNQNNLNGNLDTLKKTSIINNNEQFNYLLNFNNILLHGMKIKNIISKIKENYISVLCINTGPNTYKANQYSNILYSTERKKGFKDIYQFFGDDRKTIFIGIIILFVISILLGFIYTFILKMKMELDTLKSLIISCFIRALFKSLMSVYFITHSIILIFGLYSLKMKKIVCFDKCRLLHSYNIDTIFISKTNVLSESKFKIDSYNPVCIYNNHKVKNISFQKFKENQCKEMNLELLKYYKEYLSKNQNDNKNKLRNSLLFKSSKNKKNEKKLNKFIALFLECLLSCNNIEEINNEKFGNIIEINIFNHMKWEIKTYDYDDIYNEEKFNNKNKLKRNNTSNINKLYYNCKYSYDNNYNFIYKKVSDIFPKKYYKVTESLKEDKNIHQKILLKNNILDNDSKKHKNIKYNPILEDLTKNNINSYKLRIYKRLIKDGTLISSSIVYNFITKELRFMTKGIPEDILNKCDEKTLPENIYNLISILRINGYIVLICATKLINIEDYDDNNQIEYYMNNLTFCGYITLYNKLKDEIKNPIIELKQFNYNIVLNSGDNIFNCISDGYKSGILENNKNIFIIGKDEKDKIIINEFYNINNLTNKEKEKEKEKDNGNTNSESTDKYSKQSKKVKLKEKKDIYLPKNEIIFSQTPQILPKNVNQNKNYNIKNNRRKSEIENFKIDNIEAYLNDKLNKNNFKKSKCLKMHSINISSENRALKISNDLELKNLPNNDIPNELINQKNNKDNNFNSNYNNRKTSFQISQEKLYYYPKIFKDNKDLTDNCIYCINGKTFNFLYKNKEKKQYKYLLEKIYENCKIFYDMSSIDKSLSVEFFREFKDNCVCYIGRSQSDSDAIITSNIGINLDSPKNLNTILCHFYTDKSDILCLKKIILEGKAIYENILFLKIASIFCTMIINSYILCCFICHIDVIIGQLNLLENSLIIFLISAFTEKSNNKLKNNSFLDNRKLFFCFYTIQIIGLFFIKLVSIYIFCNNHNNSPIEDNELNSKIFCTFYFILSLELLFSSVFAFNYNSFYRKKIFDNNIFMFFIVIFLFYLLILITLTSSNFRKDIFEITYFEYLNKLIDSYSDRNKIISFNVIIIDFGCSFIYSRIIYYIFLKISNHN